MMQVYSKNFAMERVLRKAVNEAMKFSFFNRLIKYPLLRYSFDMKIWIKYLIGIVLGIATAILLPFDGDFSKNLLNFFYEFAIRFGRYTILPVIVFGVSTAVFKLRVSKKVLPVGVLLVVVLLVTTAALTLLGLISTLIIQLPRIPIPTGTESDIPGISFSQLLFRLLPFSSFDSLLEDAFLLPAFLFASLAGAGCATDINDSKHAVNVLESFSKVAYNVMSFFVDTLSIGMMAITCYWFIDARAVLLEGSFTPLIIMLTANLVLVLFVIYPVAIHFLCRGAHPFKILYASVCPITTAFFSGDTNVTLPVALKHGRESLGINRYVSDVIYPVFSVFARGGTALVTTICFVVILRSYSSLSISFTDVMWIASVAFGLSFLLGEIPMGGSFMVLTIMCVMYGRGFEAGYLLLKPMAALMGAFSAAIDAGTMMFGSYFVAQKMKAVENYELKNFI